MTSPEWYPAWVEHHCRATAAQEGTAAALETAGPIFADQYGPSEVEFLECTRRLVAGRRVPKFANDHTDAVALELERLREAAATDRPTGAVEPCDWCADAGLVTVPHPKCVAGGLVVPHPETGRVYTAHVACRCDRGRAVRAESERRYDAARELRTSAARPILTLVEYETAVCGHWPDLMREMRPPAPRSGDMAAARSRLADFFAQSFQLTG